MGHRVTGTLRDSVAGAGWELLFVAVDDHARIGGSPMSAKSRPWRLCAPASPISLA